jgi:NIPSNAP
MYYELREYHMQLAGAGAFMSAFGKDVVPWLRESGFTLLGAWITHLGPGSHTDFVWLVQWEDLDSRERAFDALHSHDGWAEFLAANKQHLTGVTSRIMKPTDFSPVA